MESTSHAFKDNARAALANQTLQKAMKHVKTGFIDKRAKARDRLPEFDDLRDVARDIKNHTLANLDFYLERYEEKVVASGGQVHWAPTGEDAVKTVLDICRRVDARVVTKGKSMISEEIALNQAMEAAGLDVVETDLGEYIIQLRKEPPSHIIAPAVHLTKEQVEADFRHHHRELPSERSLSQPEQLVAEARQMLRRRFLEADVGITGANFLVAETGTSIIVTNEGNGDLTQTLPRVHIVVASLEKVVPNLEDVSTILRVLARSATGQEFSSYTTFSTGPRRPEDLDGPEEYHVILLDNGRSNMLGGEFQDMLRCIRCGACMNHCPVYHAVGGHAYGWVYPGPMGAVLTPNLIGVDEAGHLPNASTFCGRCEAVCPMRIPLPKMMRHWREREFERHLSPPAVRAGLAVWAFFARRPKLYHFATGLQARLLGRFGRAAGRFDALPFARGWTQYRDFPAPEGRTFQQLWAERQKGGSPVSGAKQQILASLRRSLRRSEPSAETRAELERRLAAPRANLIPQRAQLPHAEQLALMEAMLKELKATVVRLADEAAVPQAIADYLKNENLPPKLRLAPRDDLRRLPWESQPLLEVEEGIAEAADTSSVTGAFAAIAETGTIMMASGPEAPVTLNFLPENHIVVLRASQVTGTYEEAWQRLRAQLGKDVMPRAVNMITGPSRTGDIEQTILLGAHGPRRLHVLLVDDRPDDQRRD